MAFGKNSKKIVKRTGLSILALVVVAAVAYEAWLLSIHSVIPNKVYRSAQLPEQVLRNVIQSKQIKTIINLRGANPNKKWYQDEFNLSQQMNIKHYDITLSSHLLPSKQRLQKLVYLLMTEQRPILVHCLSGSDRAGLASAIALILNGKQSLKDAEQQFSWKYFVTSKDSIGKQVFFHYSNWLIKNHLKNSKTNFLKWLCTKNPLDQQNLKDYPKNKYPFCTGQNSNAVIAKKRSSSSSIINWYVTI